MFIFSSSCVPEDVLYITTCQFEASALQGCAVVGDTEQIQPYGGILHAVGLFQTSIGRKRKQ